MRHVQLEKPQSVSIRSSHIFNTRTPCCAETIWEPEFGRDFGDGEFAVGVVDFVYADGGEANWGRDFVVEDCGGGVAGVCVDEHTGDDAVAGEGLAVCGVSVGLTGVGGGIEPAVLAEALLREGFEGCWVWGGGLVCGVVVMDEDLGKPEEPWGRWG